MCYGILLRRGVRARTFTSERSANFAFCDDQYYNYRSNFNLLLICTYFFFIYIYLVYDNTITSLWIIIPRVRLSKNVNSFRYLSLKMYNFLKYKLLIRIGSIVLALHIKISHIYICVRLFVLYLSIVLNNYKFVFVCKCRYMGYITHKNICTVCKFYLFCFMYFY